MILLCDIGNTHTHVGLATASRVSRHIDIPTTDWSSSVGEKRILNWIADKTVEGVAVCSVVPACTPRVAQLALKRWQINPFILDHKTLRGVGIRYPRPETIGPDRLANAVAVSLRYGYPSVVVDFGTAVTFDVVDGKGRYVGGIIAPGLAAMTEYLHEKTALLPRIQIRDVKTIIGKNTEEAMLIGAVHGYRGLIRELVVRLKRELKVRRLPVVATGGYARLMASGLPEITAVEPLLTLEGLRLAAHAARPR